MADEKSLAVAYNIKRRSRKGELTNTPAPTEESPRQARLKNMLFSEGGEVPEVPEAQDAMEYTPEDLEFPEDPMLELEEESPEMKRKARLKDLLSQD